MLKNSVLMDDAPAAPINPDMLAELKQEDMKQAIVERFKGRAKGPARRAAEMKGKETKKI